MPESLTAKARSRIAALLTGARRGGTLTESKLAESAIRDEAWASSWKRYYKPARVARGLYIAPTWARSFSAPRGSFVLRIDPGMAFGTGQHPSTVLALRLLLRWLRKNGTVLDIGCGSGILALAAAMRGGRVHASDVDPIAVRATLDNFDANGLHARAILQARGVPKSFPRAQLIAANITARVLSALAADLACKLRPGGILVTSGVVASGRAQVLQTMSDSGLRLVEERKLGEWYAHAHRKPARA